MKMLKIISWLLVALQIVLLLIGVLASVQLSTIILICANLIVCLVCAVLNITY